MPAAPAATRSAPQRVLSIDILRGLTIALMILVNDAGDSAHAYGQLRHSAWNGCTLTDLVFPSFLFLVGCSTILSVGGRLGRGVARSRIAWSILRRSATIFLLDLFLASFPYFHLTQLRLYGVLTRIAIYYLFVGLLTLVTRRIVILLGLAASFLVAYWVLLRFVPVPGYGYPTVDIPFLDPDRNLVAWIDRHLMGFLQRTIHTGRLYEVTRDPEGLLSTLPAFASTLLGACAALWLRKTPFETTSVARPHTFLKRFLLPEAFAPWYPRTEEHRRDGLLAFGLLLLLLGLVWNHWFPLNKKLWTSSFVLFTAGISTLALTTLYWIYDVRHLERHSRLLRVLLKPSLIFGTNAITAYVVSELFVEIMTNIRVPDSGLSALASSPPTVAHPALATVGVTHISAWLWTYRHLFAFDHSTDLTSFLFALAYVAFCFIPNYILWRRHIFLKL